MIIGFMIISSAIFIILGLFGGNILLFLNITDPLRDNNSLISASITVISLLFALMLMIIDFLAPSEFVKWHDFNKLFILGLVNLVYFIVNLIIKIIRH